MKLRFYKEETGDWFADLPAYIEAGGTKEDCMMVAGADTWLDVIAKGNNEVTIEAGMTPLTEFIKCVHVDDQGGTYIAHYFEDQPWNHQLWLCNVTRFLFGDFPKVIYYQIIS